MDCKEDVTEFSINLSLKMFNLKQQPQLIESVARLMNSEWPRNLKRRIEKIEQDLLNKDGFPLHLIITTSLIPRNNENKMLDPKYLYVIGHGKVTKSHHVKHGYTGIIYDVVIDKKFRGLKLGNKLLIKLEEIALKNNMTYLYLSTYSAINFYKKLGYKQRIGKIISDLRKNANRLTTIQVEKLENLFINKLKKYHDSNNMDNNKNKNKNNNNIWLTKRICRFIKPIHNQMDEIINIKFKQYINNNKYDGFCYMMPFIEQVGPCCSFAAMANIEYFINNWNKKNKQFKNYNNITFIGIQSISNNNYNNFGVISKYLLNQCIEKKICLDGEMYDLNVLCNILNTGFGEKWNFKIIECNLKNCYKFICDINSNLKQNKLSFLLIPYDKDYDNNPQIQNINDNNLLFNDYKHTEMDEIDIDYNIEKRINDNDKNKNKIIANSAHYAVVCGGFWNHDIVNHYHQHQLNDNKIIQNVTKLIQMIDDEDINSKQLKLIYMTSSKNGLHIIDANILIESNNSLKHQIIPSWTLNHQIDLGHKMINIDVFL